MYVLYPLLAVLIWSINSIVNKLSAGVIDPGVISFYRWLFAFIVLTPFVLPYTLKYRKRIYPHWWKLAILGALGLAIFQCLAYYAAQSVTALFMGISNAIIPLFSVLLSIVVFRAIPTVGVFIGSILSFAGLVWLISDGHPTEMLTQGINLGEILMLIAAFSYALYGVLIKYWQIPISNWQALYIQIIFALIYLFPGFIIAPDIGLTTQSFPLVFFAGIMASVIAPFVWITGIHHLGADKTAIFLNLAPIFTSIIAVIFLHEHLSQNFLMGGCVVLAGVVLAQLLKKPLFNKNNRP